MIHGQMTRHADAGQARTDDQHIENRRNLLIHALVSVPFGIQAMQAAYAAEAQ
jgi:hypothetical protein